MQVTRKAMLGAVIGVALVTLGASRSLAEDATVRIAQATSALSFLPIWAARALDTFKGQGLTLSATVVPGGDPNALAALDSGDVELAAVGSEAVLRAVAKGQPFQIVASLMSKVTLQLVVSAELAARTGVKPSDPLEKRLAALKGATVGVSSIGGAQDTAARWLAAKGGLDPKLDINVAQVGNPPALRAALENKRIDAFVLSPPEGYLAEKSGAGKILVALGDVFPLLSNQPFLVLVAKTPVAPKTADLVRRALAALAAASKAVVDNPDASAAAIQKQFFARAEPDSITAAVAAMKSGVADGGRLSAEGLQNLLVFSKEVGTDFGREFDARTSENQLWTNSFLPPAGK